MHLIFKNNKKTLRLLQCIIIPVIDGFILAVLLFAGLYPFNFFQKNNCHQESSGALEFRENGIAYFNIPSLQGLRIRDFFTIDCELIPVFKPGYASVICSMYDSRGEMFTIRQWKSRLIVRSGNNETSISIENQHVLSNAHITCIIDSSVIRVLSGNKERVIHRKHWSGNNNKLLVVLGNSGALNSPWRGKINTFRLNSCLMVDNKVSVDKNCLYSNEYFSMSIPDTGFKNSVQLKIPNRLYPLRPEVLVPPWVDFKKNKIYFKDLIVNYFGFFPAGFFFCALAVFYIYSIKKTVVFTTACCVAISMFIELLQVFLPERHSQLSDVLLNGAGGLTGALLCIYMLDILKKIR